MTKFMDDVVLRSQLEKDLKTPSAFYLAPKIKESTPDYLERTWLSSGIPEINAYLPIHYFVAHNPHFSHHAAKYSERLEVVKELAKADVQKFSDIMNESEIDALLLYKEKDSSSYPLFFWQDNYPNGGKELKINILKENVDALGWDKAYEDKEWVIFLKNKD